jgi:hypothetical protein
VLCVQVAKAAEDSAIGFHYDLSNTTASAKALVRMAGVPEAVAAAGYPSLAVFAAEAEHTYEVVAFMSTFCLTPPGDTPTRRGFVEALLMGCIPVVFDERTRSSMPWYLSEAQLAQTTVLLDADSLGRDMSELEVRLQALWPQVPAMRLAIAAIATSLQYAYADPSEKEHSEVGPDALDVALYRMTSRGLRSASVAAL